MSGRKPTAAPGLCECHGKPSAECPRNRSHKITAKEQHDFTVTYMATQREPVEVPMNCRCAQGPQPAHPAHKDRL